MASNSSSQPLIYADHTHLGRRVTGLERITLELFSEDSLAPLKLTPIKAKGTASLIARQNLLLPLKMALHRQALMLCPGFPPSLPLQVFGRRVIPYIHDLFLIERPQDLNVRARHYMAPAFAMAVKKLPHFMVNSLYTESQLRKYCRRNAEIWLYRPEVGNLFGLDDAVRHNGRERDFDKQPLRLIALGTIEPRKNLLAAAEIVEHLHLKGFENAQLDLVGRFGWGRDVELLQKKMAVNLHGYQPMEVIRKLMAGADLFINTSHDEGLGLPLLEAQYAGLPVIAPDAEVFREVLGESGLFIDPGDPAQSADRIAALLSKSGWRSRYADLARANLRRWNDQAAADRSQMIENLSRLAANL